MLSFLNAAGTVKHRIEVPIVVGFANARMFPRTEENVVEDGDDRRMEGAEKDGVMMLLVNVVRARLAKRVASAMV